MVMTEAQREYQQEFLRILRMHYDELMPLFGEWLKKEGITFEDIATVAMQESSLGFYSGLCEPGHNPFEIKGLAFEDAKNEAAEHAIPTHDMIAAYKAYNNPVCEVIDNSLHIPLNFHRQYLGGILKAFLLYLRRISTNYDIFVPRIEFCNRFEELMLTFYVGPNSCAKQLEKLPIDEWDEETEKCLRYPARPKEYLESLRKNRVVIKDFFG